jgi:predicted nuclease with TOPRIM domain
MSEETKFTEEELKQVKEIQDNYFNIQNRFGQITLAKIRLEQQLDVLDNQEEGLHKEFSDIQEKEKTFLNGVTEKYGEGSLNPDTGIFTSNKLENKSE